MKRMRDVALTAAITAVVRMLVKDAAVDDGAAALSLSVTLDGALAGSACGPVMFRHGGAQLTLKKSGRVCALCHPLDDYDRSYGRRVHSGSSDRSWPMGGMRGAY